MARKRNSGSLLPFAAGVALGYFLFKGKTTTTTATPIKKGPNQAQPGTILTFPGNPALRGFTLHSGGVLRPEYHNLYL